MAVSPLVNLPGTVIPSPSSKGPYLLCNTIIPRRLSSLRLNAKPKQWKTVRAAQDTKETITDQSAEQITQKYGLEAGLWKVITHPWQAFVVICIINVYVYQLPPTYRYLAPKGVTRRRGRGRNLEQMRRRSYWLSMAEHILLRPYLCLWSRLLCAIFSSVQGLTLQLFLRRCTFITIFNFVAKTNRFKAGKTHLGL